MRSHRLGLICLISLGVWLAAAVPLGAQSRLPPVEEESPPPAFAWEEQSLASQLYQSPEGAPLELPLRPRGGEKGMREMGGMGGPGGGSPFSAYSFFQPESSLANQFGTLQVRGAGVALGFPVSKGTNGIWILNSRIEHSAFETDATLPGSSQPFPAELWNINLGLMHIHPLENGWTAGGMVGIGSASDRPFASIDEMNANVLAFLNVPTRERDAWNFSLFYAPLGQLAFPIPGLAYAWRPSEQFQMNIGLPFSLSYRPTGAISFDLSYVPLTNGSATVRWTPTDEWAMYLGYQTHSQGYQLADRLDARERLWEFDQRLKVGARRTLGAGFALDCSAAYLFDRSYFRSDSFFSSDVERLQVDPGAQFTLTLEWAR